jgi:hypothetical protein
LAENTWTVLGSPSGVQWRGRPTSADLTLSGPATSLLLALLRRRSAEDTGISMQGDTALWRSWLALTHCDGCRGRVPNTSASSGAALAPTWAVGVIAVPGRPVRLAGCRGSR